MRVPFYNAHLVYLRIFKGAGLVCHGSIRGQLRHLLVLVGAGTHISLPY